VQTGIYNSLVLQLNNILSVLPFTDVLWKKMDSRDFMPTSSKPSYDRLADVLEDDEVEALAGGSHATPLCHSHELQSLFLPRVSSRTPLILSMTLNLGLLLVLMALGGALYQNTLPREPTYEFLGK
jgi:hypothetical protein